MAIMARVARPRRLTCLGAGAMWMVAVGLALAPASAARGQVSAIESAETSEGGPEEGDPPRLPTTRLRVTATPAPRGR